MPDAIDITDKLSNYLNFVYAEKNKIKSVVQTNYKKNLGNTLANFGENLQTVDGNKVLGRMASNALSVAYPNPAIGISQEAYTMRQVKAFNIDEFNWGNYTYTYTYNETGKSLSATQITVFPELIDLDIDSEQKFMFWMFGRTDNIINNIAFPRLFIQFPNLEKLTIHNINTIKNTIKNFDDFSTRGYGLFTDDTGYSLFKGCTTIFLLPKLKIIGDELLDVLVNRSEQNSKFNTNFIMDQDNLLLQNDRNFDIELNDNYYVDGILNPSNIKDCIYDIKFMRKAQ